MGRMSVHAANELNIKTIILDKQPNPACLINQNPKHINASFNDATAIAQLAKECDIVTIEIEHVNTDALIELDNQGGLAQFHPSPKSIQIIQDKLIQKEQVSSRGLPVGEFMAVDELGDIVKAGDAFGYPFLLKARKGAYDGRGNAVVKSKDGIKSAFELLGGNAGIKLYCEKFVPFIKELAVMVVRSSDGTVESYPVVETIQKDNICQLVIAPARIDQQIQSKARKIAQDTVAGFEGAGVFGVEMFLLQNGDLFLNEIAPRPHNSGHYTIEACYASQFENHIRAVAGMALGCTELKVGASVMINILGTADGQEGMNQILDICAQAMVHPGTNIHLYGKKDCKRGRKMGHITIVGDTMSGVCEISNKILASMNEAEISKERAPVVGIIMGSDSDLPTMKAAAEILDHFGVPFELTIVSAHRTPKRMFEYAETAHKRGIKVVIAAAGLVLYNKGGAAHLPGMVAAITPLPVIGVPVALKYLDGMDSLYSIVQMPRGVPVATVAINNSTNAALLAIRILGAHHPIYLEKLVDYRESQQEVVIEKVVKLKEKGWENY